MAVDASVMPYAAMEAPLFFWDVPDYINYAGVGHMIAHEIMHGFDGTGETVTLNVFPEEECGLASL